MKTWRLSVFFALILLLPVQAKRVAYIHGDVAADGTIPSGSQAPYDQMLLNDGGNTGLSQFQALVEAQGYTISQHYDAETTLDAAFLAPLDVIIFGLHQKVWSQAEQSALDAWIQKGGGILMYSDSAAGGLFSRVGIKNPVGQTAVNSILSQYGMQVAVDQGGGTRAYVPNANSSNPIIWDVPIFEGEGVSPVAVDPTGPAQVLIPLAPANRVSNSTLNIDDVGITITDPLWAVVAYTPVGRGHVMAIFDRQPMWNNGPGSDINEEDNKEVLRRIVRFLARDYGNSPEWFQFGLQAGSVSDFEVTFRQWSGGTGQVGFDYVARNQRFAIEQQEELDSNGWRRESALVGNSFVIPFGDGESETVRLQLLPESAPTRWFARLAVSPQLAPQIPTVTASGSRIVALSGSAWVESVATNTSAFLWEKVSGPGVVTFNDSIAAQTSATFSVAGNYELKVTASSANASSSDTFSVLVVNDAQVKIAINCGGSAYAGSNGFTYTADQLFNGGGVDHFPGNAVAGTIDDSLYNTARSKPGFTGYTIPMNDGNYLVALQFAETYFTADGMRVFDLSLEGTLVLDDLDLHASAPAKWVAYERIVPVTVTGNSLELVVSASINNPLINGIVVVELP